MLDLRSAGSHQFPQSRFIAPDDVLYKVAGIDMSTTQPIEDAFAVLEEYVDRLGVLTGNWTLDK